MLRRGGDTCHKNHKKRDLELQEMGHHGLQEEQVGVLLLEQEGDPKCCQFILMGFTWYVTHFFTFSSEYLLLSLGCAW